MPSSEDWECSEWSVREPLAELEERPWKAAGREGYGSRDPYL